MAEQIHTLEQAFTLAVEAQQGGAFDDAESIYRQILAVNPAHSPSLGNLGIMAKQRGDLAAAERLLREALDINPRFVDARLNLAVLYQETRRHGEALNCYHELLADRPASAQVHYNLGNLHDELGEHAEAAACFEKSLACDPDRAETHMNLGMNLLLTEKFERGFAEYEWRNAQPAVGELHDTMGLRGPAWQGEALGDESLLVVSEQGLGDTIQFARYVYALHDEAPGCVTFMTHRKLMHLFAESEFQVVAMDDPPPPYDRYVMLMSLPGIFQKRGRLFPACVDFIPKKPEASATWRNRLADVGGVKVGIHWQGSPRFPNDRSRSMPLACFSPLFDVAGASFVSLQRGLGTGQIAGFDHRERLFTGLSEIDVDAERDAFEDSIGVLRNLDLVVTSCTALAHLASTIGVKTWIALPVSPDWRWFLNASTTPWYPRTTLYRQPAYGDWAPVFTRISEDLRAKVGGA